MGNHLILVISGFLGASVTLIVNLVINLLAVVGDVFLWATPLGRRVGGCMIWKPMISSFLEMLSSLKPNSLLLVLLILLTLVQPGHSLNDGDFGVTWVEAADPVDRGCGHRRWRKCGCWAC